MLLDAKPSLNQIELQFSAREAFKFDLYSLKGVNYFFTFDLVLPEPNAVDRFRI